MLRKTQLVRELKNLEKLVQKNYPTFFADASEFRFDNKALLLMLQGACLRQMDKPLLAEEALEEAISLEAKLREDTFIIPYSKVELALIMLERDETAKAMRLLEDAKYVYFNFNYKVLDLHSAHNFYIRKNYNGYMMESRLQFMIHLALPDAADRTNNS